MRGDERDEGVLPRENGARPCRATTSVTAEVSTGRMEHEIKMQDRREHYTPWVQVGGIYLSA